MGRDWSIWEIFSIFAVIIGLYCMMRSVFFQKFSRFCNNGRALRLSASFLTFFGALLVYILTLEPDASFWDCPEYLVTAVRMEIGHPPGNPFWSLTARIFSLFGGSDPQSIALAVNFSSALFTALACALLSSSLFILLRFLPGRFSRPGAFIASLSAGLIFAWSDSPWFSAVEAEVYAFSLFLTALCFRLMLGWALMRNRGAATRQLLLIVYLTGLSIGVHQLNLLVIPALALIWLFRRYRGRTAGWKPLTLTLLVSMGIVGVILLGMMPGVIYLASRLELFCVNVCRLPFHSGVILFWILAGVICWGVPIWLQTRRDLRHSIVVMSWIPALLLTGYSSYMILLVRGAANPPMNEGAPTNIFALASYLGRDQYGSTPLFYGRTPYSRPMRVESFNADSTPSYSAIARKYKSPLFTPDTTSGSRRYHLYDHASEIIYTPELNMLFPRLTSSDPSDISCYADWAGMTPSSMKSVEISYALDSLGNAVGKLNSDGTRTREMEMRPTYMQNLRYLLGYQISYMYLRYLMWNFAGKQNDRFGTGEVEHANFITGIPLADNAMLGDQKMLPDEIGKGNRGRNRYFLLPLLFGILGMFFLQSRGRTGERANTIILMLFLMTGVAIVVYLNQSPREPRERDYSFLGSFWAYALWIGAGLYAMLTFMPEKYLKSGNKIVIHTVKAAAPLIALLIPAWMLYENFDDHDRSGRQGVSDFSANFLESLEPDAILFTNGDNFTFPLWWAQEVCGVRRDVTIINTAYLSTPWYVSQLMIPGEGHPALNMQMPARLLPYGDLNVSYYLSSPLIPIKADSLAAVDATEALKFRYSSGKDYKFPAMLRIAVPGSNDSIYLRTSAIASASSHINLRRLATLDILASNAASDSPRPVYWQSSLSATDFAGLYPFTSRTLHTRRLTYLSSPDSMRRLLDHDLRMARTTRAGVAPGFSPEEIYADATFGPMITSQRQALLRLGGRLLKADRPADALEIARLTQRLFPHSAWEFQIFTESDSTCYEGIDLARLLMESSRRLSPLDTSAFREGRALLEREYLRHKQWQDYRNALPRRYRNVLTPKNMRKSRMIPYIDSLRKVYSAATL